MNAAPTVVLVVATAAAVGLGASAQQDFDCVPASCPTIEIAGDAVSTQPDGRPSAFSGFADPTLRRDPQSGHLWMAYSWPNIRTAEEPQRRLFRRNATGRGGGDGQPGVDIHLARSVDDGRTWRFERKLWAAVPATAPDGARGHLGHEVANLLPVRTAQGLAWFGARLQYFLPERGGFGERPVESFRILVSRAGSPDGLASAPAVQLGSARTDDRYGMDVRLTDLSPSTRHCMLWNEPALYHDGRELFLALSCMAFRGPVADMERSDLMLFATDAAGPVTGWRWRFAGALSGEREARDLGGTRLTQIDLAESRDGRLLAIVTPDTWDDRARDFVHHGCRVVEVERAGGGLRLARDAAGVLRIRAVVRASDAGSAGTAACSYEPASATGVVMTKREKEGGRLTGATRLTASLHRTGLHP